MSGQIVISYELKDAAPAFILFMSIKTGWVFAHRTVGETNLYDKKIIPRGLTTFSGHTRSGLHGNYQISPL